MLAETGVVTVLLAATRVASGDLQVTIFVRTDPHVGPSRRNNERSEPIDHFARANHLAVGVDVPEPATMALTANARHRIGNVSEARGSRGPHVFVCDRLTQCSSSSARSVVTPQTARRRGGASDMDAT